MSRRGSTMGTAAAVTLRTRDLLGDLRPRLAGCVVVMGIGNPDRGDDGAGLRVAELLAGALDCPGSGDVRHPLAPVERFVTVILAADVPEGFLGPAILARPDAVLLVDAAEMDAEPGAVALLEPADLGEGAALTHRTPLTLLSTFLSRETGADVLLLAIQPRSLEWGEPMSPEVEAAARHLADILAEALRRETVAC